MKDPRLARFVLAHLLTVIGEWAATVGILVHAYDWGGSSAVGPVSIAVLFPPVICSPFVARLTARHRAHRVRLAGFAVQTLGYGGAAVAAAAGAPTPVVAAFVVVGLGAINTLRPTGAIMMPAVVRSTGELVSGNLWVAACDSSSALVGPLVAAAFAGLGGSSAVFAACAGGAALATAATAWRAAPLALVRPSIDAAAGVARVAGAPEPAGGGAVEVDDRRPSALRVGVRDIRSRPWSIGVLGVASARNIVVGAFDVLLVILALKTLDLGDGGPGLLSALVGTGALVSTFVTTVVVRRSRLRPALLIALVCAAALCVSLGLVTEMGVAVVVLPLMGVCLSSMDNLSRMLLQRSTDPRRLGPLFAILGLVSGAAQLVGSVIAQVLLAVADLETALVGVGTVLAVTAIAGWRPLRRADANAEVPVVEMSLLASIPMFSHMPAGSLEAVARAAERIEVADGRQVIVQGEQGDVFYAVAEGEFDIVMNDDLVRTASRGGFFGEVALLSDRPRTATVTCRRSGVLLGIHREPFLVAVTGHDRSHAVALAHVSTLDLGE